MTQSKWPVFVINLERSKDRWINMSVDFAEEDLIRVEGVDGREWETGEFHMNGRPKFREGVLEGLTETGVLAPDPMSKYPWVPCEIGCALSHLKVWRRIVSEGIPWAIVMEDDAEPTELVQGGLQASLLREFPLPGDAEVVFLHGADTPYNAIVVDEENRLVDGFGNIAYAISLQGARRAIRAQVPIYYPCDFQWWTRAFKGLRLFSFVPETPIEKGQAYAVRKSLIRFGRNNVMSTFTPSGLKPWKSLPYENGGKKAQGC